MAVRGTHKGPDDHRSPGPRCIPAPAGSAATAAVAEDMAAVLAVVLTRAPGAWHMDAPGAAQALLPAVSALRGLADRLAQELAAGSGAVGLEGLIHRRCLVLPAGVAAAGGRHGAGEALRRSSRGGWELIRSATTVTDAGPAWPDGARVIHDLARRATASVRVPGAGIRETASTPAQRLALTAADLRAWAEATGDHNPIHLSPGRARRHGMPVGEDDVVAHGLLLGALSLACVPAAGAVDLRFSGAVPLRPGRAATVTIHADGTLTADGRVVLLRRAVGLGPGGVPQIRPGHSQASQ